MRLRNLKTTNRRQRSDKPKRPRKKERIPAFQKEPLVKLQKLSLDDIRKIQDELNQAGIGKMKSAEKTHVLRKSMSNKDETVIDGGDIMCESWDSNEKALVSPPYVLRRSTEQQTVKDGGMIFKKSKKMQTVKGGGIIAMSCFQGPSKLKQSSIGIKKKNCMLHNVKASVSQSGSIRNMKKRIAKDRAFIAISRCQASPKLSQACFGITKKGKVIDFAKDAAKLSNSIENKEEIAQDEVVSDVTSLQGPSKPSLTRLSLMNRKLGGAVVRLERLQSPKKLVETDHFRASPITIKHRMANDRVLKEMNADHQDDIFQASTTKTPSIPIIQSGDLFDMSDDDDDGKEDLVSPRSPIFPITGSSSTSSVSRMTMSSPIKLSTPFQDNAFIHRKMKEMDRLSQSPRRPEVTRVPDQLDMAVANIQSPDFDQLHEAFMEFEADGAEDPEGDNIEDALQDYFMF